MRRRALLAFAAFAVAQPFRARAQQVMRRIGWLGFARNPHLETAFTERLRELGLVRGRDYEIEFRVGEAARLPELAEELALLGPAVIVAANSASGSAANRAMPAVPIVIGATYDPPRLGLASSYARPEGNITGVTAGWETVAGKQLELGFELVPGHKLAGHLQDTVASLGNAPYRQGIDTAASIMGAKVLSAEIKTQDEIEAAFDAFRRQGVNFVVVMPSPMFFAARRRIAELALAHRLPIVCAFREHAEAGALMSYGTDLRENYRHVAVYVDKILKGESVAALPVQDPPKLELVVNLKTARALGLAVPASVLARADEVID